MTDPTDPAITAQDHWDYLGSLALGDDPAPLAEILRAVQALVCGHHLERLAAAPVSRRGRPGAIQATATALGITRPLVRAARDQGLPRWLLGLEDPPRSAEALKPRGAPARGRRRRAA